MFYLQEFIRYVRNSFRHSTRNVFRNFTKNSLGVPLCFLLEVTPGLLSFLRNPSKILWEFREFAPRIPQGFLLEVSQGVPLRIPLAAPLFFREIFRSFSENSQGSADSTFKNSSEISWRNLFSSSCRRFSKDYLEMLIECNPWILNSHRNPFGKSFFIFP